MPPPNIVYYEYIHEDVRIRLPSGKVRIFYEPFEHRPVFNVEGTIFLDNILLQNFYNCNDDIKFIKNESCKSECVAIVGFLNEQNSLVFVWNTEPVEHFLCVTYNFDEEYLKKTEINWLGEGF